MQKLYISIAKENSKNAVNFYDKEITFNDLHLVTKNHHYSVISFKDGYRKGTNFQGLGLIALDIDDGHPINEMIEKLGDQKALIVTTRSHQLSVKNGKAIIPRDRYRLFLPLEKPITDPEQYKIVITNLITEFKADKACVDTARFFYCNHNQEVYYVN